MQNSCVELELGPCLVFDRTKFVASPISLMVALYLAKWLDTVEQEKQAGLLDSEEMEILQRLHDLMSQTELNIQDVSLPAVVLELGAGLLMETWVYGCISLAAIAR
jgi:hypothetical protein